MSAALSRLAPPPQPAAEPSLPEAAASAIAEEADVDGLSLMDAPSEEGQLSQMVPTLALIADTSCTEVILSLLVCAAAAGEGRARE